MDAIFILCGPQAVGKTRNAETLFKALCCTFLVDDWNGLDPLRPGTLAITNAEYTMPEGGVAFHIEDESGLKALLEMRRVVRTQLFRQPYSTGLYSCSCGASYKDECICKRDTNLSNTPSATSGVALSSNTD